MRYVIADTFTKSVAALDARARAAVKRAAFDLMSQPDGRGQGRREHRLVHARDTRFWSVRVNRDLRIIVLRTGEQVVLCQADHHDQAYAWAEERKLRPRAVPAGSIVEAPDQRPLPPRAVHAGLASRASDSTGESDSCLAVSGGGSEVSGREALRDRRSPLTPPGQPLQVRKTAKGESEPAAAGARQRAPRRLRTRDRAMAPLPESAPVHAARSCAPPPLAQLLWLARCAAPLARPAAVGAPSEPPRLDGPTLAPPPSGGRAQGRRDQRALASRAVSPPRPGSLGAKRLVALATGAAAISASACIAAPDLALRAVAGAAALAATLLALATRQRLSSASRDALAAVAALRDAVEAGQLGARADPAPFDAEWRDLVRTVNAILEAFAEPFSSIATTLASLARGDVPPRLAGRFEGDFERHRAAVEALVDFVTLRPEDIRALVNRCGDRPE